MRKPWETEELSEDWIEEESKEEEEIKRDSEEKVEELKNQSVRKKRGYGTVKINTIGKPTTISFSAIKTLQEGGTLVIHENKNDSIKSQSTIKANKESKLKWNMKNKDFFTPLSLEVMFEKPKEKIMKNVSPSKIPLVKNSPNLAPCLSNGKLLASPLRRISAHRGVHFKLNSRDPSPYTLEPRNLPFNLNIKEVPDRPHTAPQGLIKEEKMKRSVSNEGGRINNKTSNTSNLELFPSQYDLDTQNNLSQLLNQLDGSESDKTSSLSQGSSSEKGIKRMVSAPNLSAQLSNRPSPFRMLTPHPPTWEWLKMQSESECSAINEGEYVNQNNSFSFDEDINEHDWLKELPLEIGDLSEPRSSSTLSKKSNNLATPNQNQPKQMITNEIITNSFRKEMNLSNNNNNTNSKIKNNSPISMELWEEFFKTKQSKLGPDRVAEQLKKYGILPYYYLDSYPVLIQPHQLGNVPKLVNNMKFDSLNLKWKPLMEDEDDPFKSIKTLKLNSTEFKNMINAAKGNNNNILNNSSSILNINTNSNILNTNTNNIKRKVELNKYLKQNQENANLDLDLDLNAFLNKDKPATLSNNLNDHKSNIDNLLKDNLNQEEEEEESLTEFLNNKTQLNESISSVDSNDNKDSDNEEDEEELDLKAFLNKNKNKENKILNKKKSLEINSKDKLY
ncbi:hypothetical protein K502DRAFT_330584 [Neoconidiobolus thromboides FSU 785]|nr:hypothetical protein K502DRAFT_330584 [Neoconidiobolus thromboides FSU 785]